MVSQVVTASIPLPAPVVASNGHSDSPTPTKLRRVCVSGFAEATREVANRQPKDVEIWGLNRCYMYLKRWDRWYEVHEEELYTGKTGLREDGYLDLLRKSNVPVYMLNPLPVAELPQVRKYPHHEISERFRDYFTNSIAYMLAHAAYEHVNGNPIHEVLICGVDMSAYSEYNEQRPCVEYWLGVLDGLGIKVTVPSASPILKAAVTYGKRNRAVLWSQVKERVAHHKIKQQELAAQLNAAAGIVGDLDQMFKVQKEGKDPLEWAKVRLNEVRKAHAQINADLNAEIGGLREAQHMLTVVNAPQSEAEEPEPVKTVG